MNLEWHDGLGGLGTALILLGYLLLQLNRLRVGDLSYSLLNWMGAALVLASLSHNFNLAAAVLEFSWLAISSVGVAAWFIQKRNCEVAGAIVERNPDA